MSSDCDQGPWHYLSGSTLSSELIRPALLQTIHKTDCVTLQPCTNPAFRSQDRFVVLQLEVGFEGNWAFTAVFDGHAGEETADYLVASLPPIIQGLLTSALTNAPGNELPPATVSNILVKAISEVDNAISRDIVGLFPDGPEETPGGGFVDPRVLAPQIRRIEELSDDQIDAIVNDFQSGLINNAKVLRGLRGSTALVSLVDPSGKNLWVASLGDCQAVLGTKMVSGEWKAELLSHNHNGTDQGELERLMSEHPGEDGVVLNDRVLGAIAVTRAIGDHEFKLPEIYTRRILSKTNPGFRLSTKLEDFLPRNLTPPYLSNIADVEHVDLQASDKDGRFLIMCSDGLIDLYMYDDVRDLTTLKNIAEHIVEVVAEGSKLGGNAALFLLREALGGNDKVKVSRIVPVDMKEECIDDTTVLVQTL